MSESRWKDKRGSRSGSPSNEADPKLIKNRSNRRESSVCNGFSALALTTSITPLHILSPL